MRGRLTLMLAAAANATATPAPARLHRFTNVPCEAWNYFALREHRPGQRLGGNHVTLWRCRGRNPPFSGKVQDESILADLNYKLDTRATELLFLKWFVDHLAPTGRAGVIVPNGVLFGSTNAATKLREMLLTECELQAVISLPSGVFKPYAGVATAALIFQKGKPTQSVWFYDMTADGFTLDDKRTPIEANDIPDVVAKWPNRDEGPNSYRVPIDKIKANDWSLAAGRYKPVTTETVNHDEPGRILADVLKLENEIVKRSNALFAKINTKK